VNVHVSGDRLDLAGELEDDFRKEAVSVVREGVDMLVTETRAKARQTGSRVSEPGETPGVQSGDLEKSIRRGRVRLGRDKVSVSGEMVSTLTYPEVNGVEYGHVKPTGQRVLPRPFLRPAAAEVEPKIETLFREWLS
jgi:hypothetical protein